MNKVIVVGNVCNDIEIKKTATGKSVCEFAVAVNENYNGENKAEYIDVQAWEKSADILGQYVSKGNKILVEGKLRSSVFTDAKGDKRKKTVVLLTNFEFLTPKNDASGAHSDSVQESAPVSPVRSDAQAGAPTHPTVDLSPDELPFY